MIKDSGDRTQFESGAVRDIQKGKGRCDLLPPAALLRIAKHFEAGAVKYGDRNWELGIPMHSFVDSGIRHLLKYMDGWTDEDHLCAAAWNILCALETEEKRPEMQDIPSRLKADTEPRKGKSQEPIRIAPPDLRSMKGQMVYFVPYADDEKPRWMQVVYDFVTEPNEKMWALYKNPDDFMYLSEIENLGIVFTGECNPELTVEDIEKMDEQTVWVAPPKDQFKAMLHRISLSEDQFIDPNGQYFCIKNVFDGTDQLKGTKVYRYEKTND